jgi:hypothetical protein
MIVNVSAELFSIDRVISRDVGAQVVTGTLEIV